MFFQSGPSLAAEKKRKNQGPAKIQAGMLFKSDLNFLCENVFVVLGGMFFFAMRSSENEFVRSLSLGDKRAVS